jgi:gamma-glutamyltranspeptidase/glutathione hydrolase
VAAPHAAVASANSLASEAGVEILKAGGNAVDAAVATAFAIGVVEPQMSGLGGGGGMTIWLEEDGRPYYLDFYAAQNAARMVSATGPRKGGTDLRVVGIPGETAGLLAAHERFGRLPRARVMEPAIRLAEEGFPVGQILGGFVASDSAKLHRFPEATEQWWPGGRPLGPGDRYRNPTLAATLRDIAERGPSAFYQGPVAEAVVETLNAHGHPATLADLAGYRPQWKRPLCTDYRGLTVLSAPPPQTGMQVLETLELLEPFDLPSLGLPTESPRAFDVLTSALRVGQADAQWNDDPRWADVPAASVSSQAYAGIRGSLVGSESVPDELDRGDADALAPDAAPGCGTLEPWGAIEDRGPSDVDGTAGTFSSVRPGSAVPATAEASGGETTHMSVVDADGNAVALTQTNSTVFGSGAWVRGFFLNDSGYLWRDSVGAMPAGTTWRTRNSTISPTVVLDGDDVRMVIGAPGGGRIPTEIAQVMVYILDYGMDPLEAVRMPRIYPDDRNPEVQLEHGFTPELLAGARSMGWQPVPEAAGYARLYLVVREGDGWVAVSDPRHDGEPRGY